MNNTIEIDNSYFLNAERLFKESSEAVLSMLNTEQKTFIRNTESTGDKFYTSATLHSIISLFNCGYFCKAAKIEGDKIKTPYFILNSKKFVKASEFINYFEEFKLNIEMEGDNWADKLIKNSSHAKNDTYNPLTSPNLRTALVFDLLLNALNCLCKSEIDVERTERESLKDIFVYFENHLIGLIGELTKKKETYSPGKTPAPLIHIITCILSLNELEGNTIDKLKFKNEITDLELQIDSHIDFHMARCRTNSISLFDPVSLASALFAKSKVQPSFKQDPFFLTCLKTVMDFQYDNGCWPDGISLSFSSTGDVVQQPSVGVAVSIAEAAIDESFLIDFDENIEQILNIVLPGLRKTAKYLAETFESKITYENDDVGKVSGWSSDRIRRTEYAEAWINSLTCRFFYRLWIAEMALLRFQSLKKLGVKYYKSLAIKNPLDVWDKEVTDPDIIIKPTEVVKNKYVKPILERKNSFGVIHAPNSNGVSFILFGPPGSGKTHFVHSIAKVLDWPLVELSPGHFIKNGLELIEATAKGLFDTLDNICHAVVFFDECDELFKERSTDTATRSILSFATASMLPKLQKLHDNKKIIFVLGTNYVANIDTAIRRPGRFDDILLLDRPDKDGRMNFFNKKSDMSIGSEFEKDTEYYTFSEMMQFINTGSKLSNSSEDDYKIWCKTNGEKELDASRYTNDEKINIKTRWNVEIT